MDLKMATRAQYLGIKPAQMARKAKAKLKRIDALLVDIGGIYGDIDQTIVDKVDELRRWCADELVAALDDSTEFLNSSPDDS